MFLKNSFYTLFINKNICQLFLISTFIGWPMVARILSVRLSKVTPRGWVAMVGEGGVWKFAHKLMR